MMANTNSVTSPRRVSAAEKRTKATIMRRAGAHWDQIAKECGYAHKGSAQKAVKIALGRAEQVAVDDLRQLENERLDALQAAVWRDAMSGNTDSVHAALRVIHQRIGLNAIAKPVEFELRLGVEQVDYLEAVLRRVLDAVHTMLAQAGLDELLAEQWPIVLGEVVPRELAAAAMVAGASAPDGDDDGGEPA